MRILIPGRLSPSCSLPSHPLPASVAVPIPPTLPLSSAPPPSATPVMNLCLPRRHPVWLRASVSPRTQTSTNRQLVSSLLGGVPAFLVNPKTHLACCTETVPAPLPYVMLADGPMSLLGGSGHAPAASVSHVPY